jgi:hypothetical protein
LQDRDPDSAIIAARHRPEDTAASTKGSDALVKGLTPPFSARASLADLVKGVDKHLVKHGMETIAYVQDPSDKSKVLSSVKDALEVPARLVEQDKCWTDSVLSRLSPPREGIRHLSDVDRQ